MSDRKKKHEKKDKKRQHSSSSSPASHASSHRHDDHSAGHRHHSKKKVSSSSQNPSQTAEKYVQSSSGKATKHSGEHSHSSTSKVRSSSGQPAQSSSVTVRHFPQNPSHHSGTHGYSSSVPSSHLAGDFNQSASGHPSSGQNKQSSTDKDVPKHFTGNMMENLAELHNTSFGAMHTIPGNWNENNDDPLSNINLATPSPCYSKSSGRSSSSASSISETRLPQSIMNPSVRENIGSETMTNVPSNWYGNFDDPLANVNLATPSPGWSRSGSSPGAKSSSEVEQSQSVTHSFTAQASRVSQSNEYAAEISRPHRTEMLSVSSQLSQMATRVSVSPQHEASSGMQDAIQPHGQSYLGTMPLKPLPSTSSFNRGSDSASYGESSTQGTMVYQGGYNPTQSGYKRHYPGINQGSAERTDPAVVPQEKRGKRTDLWTQEEWDSLKLYVASHINWDSDLRHFLGRTLRQCQEKWLRNGHHWTEEENDFLRGLQVHSNTDWAAIARQMTTVERSADEVKARRTLIEKYWNFTSLPLGMRDPKYQAADFS